MPTASPSCATASRWRAATAKDFDREKVIRAMVGRTLSNELYRTRRSAGELRRAGAKVL